MQLQISSNPSWRRTLAADDRRFWLLGSLALRIEVRANPLWAVEVYWKRLLVAGALLLVCGYLALVTAAWGWWHRKPENLVHWTDVALAPVRWEELEIKRGDTAIAIALERLKQKDYTEGYFGLRKGLPRSPANVTGRLVLSQMMAVSDPAQSLALIEEGLKYTPDNLDLLRTLFGTYATQQAGARALDQGGLLLQSPTLAPPARMLLSLGRAGLLIESGRLPEADQFLTEIRPLAATPENLTFWHRLKIDLLLAEGKVAEAQGWWQEQIPHDRNQAEVQKMAMQIAVAARDEEALATALRRLKLASGNTVGAHLQAYRAWHQLGQPARLFAEEKEFAQVFGGDDGALQALAALAVNLDQPATVRRLGAVAAAGHLSPFAFRVHLTELALRHGAWEEALRQEREWAQDIGTLPPDQQFYPKFISRLVHACQIGEETQIAALLEILAGGRGQAKSAVYSLALETLERSANFAAAQQVAVAGLRLYPLSDPLLTSQLRLQGELARAAEQRKIPALADTRPSLPATAEEAIRQIDAALAGAQSDRARDLLRAIRLHPPTAWEAERLADFAFREVKLALQTEDVLSARSRIANYLESHHELRDQRALLALAQEYLARQQTAEARLLRDAVAAQPDPTGTMAADLAKVIIADDLAAFAAAPAVALAELDRWLAARQYAEAARFLAYLREKPPGWVAASATELAVREVPLRLALDQRPLALSVYKDLVVRSGAPRSAAFRLVRDFLARGDRDNAGLLAAEVVRLLPEEPAAKKLLKETEAPRPAG